jgi:hypothetical protein
VKAGEKREFKGVNSIRVEEEVVFSERLYCKRRKL